VAGIDLAGDPSLRPVLARARDQAAARSLGRFEVGSRAYALIAQPIYDPNKAYRTVADLRAGLLGYVVGLVDLQRALQSATRGTDVIAQLRDADGTTLVATADPGVQSITPRDVRFAGTTWRLELTSTNRFGGGARLPWLVAAMGLLLAAGVAGTVAAMIRRGRAMRHAADARSRELQLVAETGPLLQQSLELADLVPAFAVKVADDFDLDAVAVTLIEGDQPVEVFSLGTWTSAGEIITLPLQRGGREVGQLRLRARRSLDAASLAALRAVAELLAAALGNVRLFGQEQETVRRLREVDRMKNDFVSTVTHEVRTMVTAIAGFADLLDQRWEALTEEQRHDFIGRISRNSASLRQLVDDMLEFSRADRLTSSLVATTVNLAEAVGGLAEQMSSLLDRHVVRLDLAPDVVADVDPRALERIVANLLSNAGKYAPAGSTVTVAVDREDGMARIAVSDEGPGIPAEERERVFARFYRGVATAGTQTRGAGVGLAVVRELVERLGGSARIETADGGGARFVILLPVPKSATQHRHLIDVSQGDTDDHSS
jgi:signal transduction histidine kinase